jgi:hypothetical protein
MKNLKYVFLVVFTMAVFSSCEKYDEYDTNREPIVRVTNIIGQSNNNVTLAPGESVTVEVGLFVSTVSNTDKTYTIVADLDETVLAPENYTIGVGTIPANSDRGSFNLTLTAVNVGTSYEALVLKVEESTEYISGATTLINVREQQ